MLARLGIQSDSNGRRHVKIDERAEHDRVFVVWNDIDMHEWTLQLMREKGHVN